jgi:iron complex outermembrane receptor protein
VDALSDTNISCTGIAGCPAALAGRYGAYYFYNPTPFYGWTSATEGYVEVGIPLLRDRPLVKSLSVDLAGRVTDYSISGMQDTWKLGLQWALNNAVQLRGTFSQDVRSPDVIELFNPGSATINSNLFPSSTGTPRNQVGGLNFSTGNPDLQPEIAHTTTGGIVLSPTSIEGLQASLDIYKIDIAHSIQQLTPQGVVDGCAAGNTAYCGLVTVNGVPVTTTAGINAATTGVVVTVPTANVGRINTAGVDFETDYTHRVGNGTFSGRLVASYLLTENIPTAVTGCSHTQMLGAIGGCLYSLGYPRWRGVVSGQYRIGRVALQMQERVIDGGKADPWDVVGVSITRNDVPTIEYTDLNLSYALGREERGHVYFNVTNLFNRDPPVTITVTRGTVPPAASSVYDILGRRFVLGYRFAF